MLRVCGSGWISVSQIDRWWRWCTDPHPRRRPAVKLPPRQGAALPLSNGHWVSLEFLKAFHQDLIHHFLSLTTTEHLYYWRFCATWQLPFHSCCLWYYSASQEFLKWGFISRCWLCLKTYPAAGWMGSNFEHCFWYFNLARLSCLSNCPLCYNKAWALSWGLKMR